MCFCPTKACLDITIKLDVNCAFVGKMLIFHKLVYLKSTKVFGYVAEALPVSIFESALDLLEAKFLTFGRKLKTNGLSGNIICHLKS